MIGKVQFSATAAIAAIGLAAPANASPVPQRPTVQDFLAAVRSAGITGADPAMLGDGYSVCWELWNGHFPANQVVAGTQHDHPQLTTDQAVHFVTAAYQDLCPVPGAYDWWAYSTG